MVFSSQVVTKILRCQKCLQDRISISVASCQRCLSVGADHTALISPGQELLITASYMLPITLFYLRRNSLKTATCPKKKFFRRQRNILQLEAYVGCRSAYGE